MGYITFSQEMEVFYKTICTQCKSDDENTHRAMCVSKNITIFSMKPTELEKMLIISFVTDITTNI